MENSIKGLKFDAGKLEYHLLPTGVVNEVIKVLMYGKAKYGEDNWKHLDNAKIRYYDAGCRHRNDFMAGEARDQESNLYHLAHSICCDIFLLYNQLMEDKKDEY